MCARVVILASIEPGVALRGAQWHELEALRRKGAVHFLNPSADVWLAIEEAGVTNEVLHALSGHLVVGLDLAMVRVEVVVIYLQVGAFCHVCRAASVLSPRATLCNTVFRKCCIILQCPKTLT